MCFHTAEAGRKLTIDRRKSGDHGIALALGVCLNGSLLIKSHGSQFGCSVVNCSRHNNLTIKRPDEGTVCCAPGSARLRCPHQVVFANATPRRPALYFTILGELALKMLRCQLQYTFFDQAKLNTPARFINRSQVVWEKDLDAALEEITKEFEKASPGIVVVDALRTLVPMAQGGTTDSNLSFSQSALPQMHQLRAGFRVESSSKAQHTPYQRLTPLCALPCLQPLPTPETLRSRLAGMTVADHPNHW